LPGFQFFTEFSIFPRIAIFDQTEILVKKAQFWAKLENSINNGKRKITKKKNEKNKNKMKRK